MGGFYTLKHEDKDNTQDSIMAIFQNHGFSENRLFKVIKSRPGGGLFKGL
jgi:hypothetical protein